MARCDRRSGGRAVSGPLPAAGRRDVPHPERGVADRQPEALRQARNPAAGRRHPGRGRGRPPEGPQLLGPGRRHRGGVDDPSARRVQSGLRPLRPRERERYVGLGDSPARGGGGQRWYHRRGPLHGLRGSPEAPPLGLGRLGRSRGRGRRAEGRAHGGGFRDADLRAGPDAPGGAALGSQPCRRSPAHPRAALDRRLPRRGEVSHSAALSDAGPRIPEPGSPIGAIPASVDGVQRAVRGRLPIPVAVLALPDPPAADASGLRDALHGDCSFRSVGHLHDVQPQALGPEGDFLPGPPLRTLLPLR
mmetsp:Transcript_106490/g.339769  ORF Transcript_106490/g.339769 Transcript_106490/m.339769 type:complete len:304 (-) Transcript_106490:346-1257(-)